MTTSIIRAKEVGACFCFDDDGPADCLLASINGDIIKPEYDIKGNAGQEWISASRQQKSPYPKIQATLAI